MCTSFGEVCTVIYGLITVVGCAFRQLRNNLPKHAQYDHVDLERVEFYCINEPETRWTIHCDTETNQWNSRELEDSASMYCPGIKSFELMLEFHFPHHTLLTELLVAIYSILVEMQLWQSNAWN